ncbi:hypothetical protein VTO42DRAFT_2956 [Malbranchea cinnamomea]
MAIGIILGNFVSNTGPALQKGTFVGVSIPIAVGLLRSDQLDYCPIPDAGLGVGVHCNGSHLDWPSGR